jgi:hypothetical protein
MTTPSAMAECNARTACLDLVYNIPAKEGKHMRRIASIVLIVSWGLWFGGLITLFMVISSLFKTLSTWHEASGLVASQIFQLFNIYQLILAAVVMLAAVLCRPWRGSWSSSILLVLLALATGLAMVVSLRLTPQIERLREAEMTRSKMFAHLHGWSMGLSAVQTLLLLGAGIVLPWVVADAFRPAAREE